MDFINDSFTQTFRIEAFSIYSNSRNYESFFENQINLLITFLSRIGKDGKACRITNIWYIGIWNLPSEEYHLFKCLDCKYLKALIPIQIENNKIDYNNVFFRDNTVSIFYSDCKSLKSLKLNLEDSKIDFTDFINFDIIIDQLPIENKNYSYKSLDLNCNINSFFQLAVKSNRPCILFCEGSNMSICNDNFENFVTLEKKSQQVINPFLPTTITKFKLLNIDEQHSDEYLLSIFNDLNFIIAVSKNGFITCWDFNENKIIWEHKIIRDKIQNQIEFVTSLVEISNNRIVLGSNLGNVWILEYGYVADDDSYICREQYTLNLSKLLDNMSLTKANSVLDISQLYNEEYVNVITSTLFVSIDTSTGTVTNCSPVTTLGSTIPLRAAKIVANGLCLFAVVLTSFDSTIYFLDLNLGLCKKKKSVENTKDKGKSFKYDIQAEYQTNSDSISAIDLSFFLPFNVNLHENSPLMNQLSKGINNNNNNNNNNHETYAQSSKKPVTYSYQSRGDSWETPVKSKSGKILDQAVTFHNRIKSSGYGQPDAFEKWKLKQQKKRNMNLHRSNSSNEDTGKKLKSYPLNLSVPSIYQKHLDPPSLSSLGPIRGLVYSSNANQLGILSSESAVIIAKLPITKECNVSSYMGHDGRITSISFSGAKTAPVPGAARPSSGPLILSSSIDGTARIWMQNNVDNPSLVFSHTNHSISKVKSLNFPVKASERNRPFSSEIIAAKFFYMDQFVLLASKSNLYMYNYKLDDDNPKENGLKNFQSESYYKKVIDWTLPSQSIGTFSCVNSIKSHLIIVSGSDKKIYILDASNGKISRTTEGLHDTNIHCIAIPQPSVHVQLPLNAYNIFATAAKDNLILLWDIRSPRSFARFSSHVNRRESVTCSFSPCLQYLGTGSEDRSARVYDIVAGKELVRYPTHRDVVSSVDFNPIVPQIATASFDGTIKFYSAAENI